MKKYFKFGTISIAIFLFLLVFTVILLPVFINEQKFLPELEKKITESTGRSFSIGKDLGISYFPWLNISFSDLKMGNPHGFSTNRFISIESFEAQIELLPLLMGQIRVKRFVVGGLEVNLERRSDGKENWNFDERKEGLTPWNAFLPDHVGGFLVEKISVDLFAVTDGKVVFRDQVIQTKHRIDDLMFIATDMSLDRSISIEIQASVDGKSVALEGIVGPLGMDPGHKPLSVDMLFVLADVFKGTIQGKVSEICPFPVYDFSVQVASFSPRLLCEKLDMVFPVKNVDPGSFDSLEFNLIVNGNRDEINVEKGKAAFDDTRMDFSFTSRDIDQPVLTVSLDVDYIDLNRYFTENGHELYDYDLLRKIFFSADVSVRTAKVREGVFENIHVLLRGSEGIITIDPLSFSFNEGQVQSTATIDVKEEQPRVSVALQLDTLQFGQLLRDLGQDEWISGTLSGGVQTEFSGLNVESIKKSLYGEGNLILQHGTLRGFDLDVKVSSSDRDAVGVEETIKETIKEPHTSFVEINSIFTVKNGFIDSQKTTLLTSLVQAHVSGTADMINNEFNLVINPVALTTRSADKDSEDQAEVLSPLVVVGTFADPRVGTDMKGVSVKGIAYSEEVAVQQLVDKTLPSPIDADVKGLVGRALIDPAVVVQRFGLQPVDIRAKETKKIFPVGIGNVLIHQLLEEDTFFH